MDKLSIALSLAPWYYIPMNSQLKPCGHRLEPKHFIKIARLARKWNIKDAPALRKIIEEAK